MLLSSRTPSSTKIFNQPDKLKDAWEWGHWEFVHVSFLAFFTSSPPSFSEATQFLSKLQNVMTFTFKLSVFVFFPVTRRFSTAKAALWCEFCVLCARTVFVSFVRAMELERLSSLAWFAGNDYQPTRTSECENLIMLTFHDWNLSFRLDGGGEQHVKL